MRTLGASEGSIAEALELGPLCLRETSRTGISCCGAVCFSGTAIVLGAAQVAARVLRSPLPSSSFRRATTGTAAYFEEGGTLWALALPTLDSVLRDATPPTVLNRNLRLFLTGFAKAGISAAYFGREWIACRHRPLALVGLEVDRQGGVLIEVLASRRSSFALPRELTTDLEASCDRYRGKEPLGLAEASRLDALTVAALVLEGIAERAGAVLTRIPMQTSPPIDRRVNDTLDPLPAGSALEPSRAIPIGYLDRGRSPDGRRFVGGDMLGPTHALGFGARPSAVGLGHLPLVGASWNEVAEAMQSL